MKAATAMIDNKLFPQIMLMKMIFQHNPHLGKGDEGMVWQRMQQALRVHEAQIAGGLISLHENATQFVKTL